MAGWEEILKELGETPSQLDFVRRKYLSELSDYTGRISIAYYSAFINKEGTGMDVNDGDMEGFMNALKGVDYSCGLDLILHTPGGDPNAAEAIVNYLKEKFENDIRVIVPQIAMSAGTMIACSAKEIVMGRQSCLGPIDPQFSGIPAYNIKEEFEEAKIDLAAHPENVHYWAIKLQQYPAAFMKTAIDAIDLSNELVRNWLTDVMLKDNPSEVDRVVNFLNSHKDSKSHGRHYQYKDCLDNGLVIKLMEDEPELQDKVLSVHHSFMITFERSDAIKIISNNHKKDYVVGRSNP